MPITEPRSGADDYLLGVDLGTSSVKVLACTVAGRVLARVSRPFTLEEPQPGWREQDPLQFYEGMIDCVRELSSRLKGRPLAMSFSSAMHSLLPVDSEGQALSRIITWADTRSWPQAEKLRQEGRAQALYSATGTPIHPMSLLCKLMWMREHQPERFTAARRFLTIKSYLIFRLSGRYLIDHSDASSIGLFNIHHLHWHAEALETAGIDADRLPEPVAADYHFQGLRPGLAAELGLPADLTLVMGATDGCLANLGSQVLRQGEASVTIGTSGAIRITATEALSDPEGRLFNYLLLPPYFICGGPVNSGGYLLQWFHQHFGAGRSLDQLLQEAGRLPAGAEGLLCLPYLLGERAPVWDGLARGAFIGLSDRHGPAHLFRALLEGICFNLRQVGQLIQDQQYPIREIVASGGFARSSFGLQLLADVFGLPVSVDEQEDASALGAVFMALYALGYRSTLELPEAVVRSEQLLPDERQKEQYSRLFPHYLTLYPALRDTLHALGRFDGV